MLRLCPYPDMVVGARGGGPVTYPINEPLLRGLYYLQATGKKPGECFHALAITNYYGDKALTRRITYMLHDGTYIQRTP